MSQRRVIVREAREGTVVRRPGSGATADRRTMAARRRRPRRPGAAIAALFSIVPAIAGGIADAASSGTTRFVLHGNRTYAELAFLRPDGSVHRALAFVDMGSPTMQVTDALFRELEVGANPLRFRIGDLAIEVPPADVDSERTTRRSIGSDLDVEALLPARVLARYEVAVDYAARTLTLARPGTLAPSGVPVPFHVNDKTGLIAVDASVEGRTFAVTIDNGSAYTWLRRDLVEPWLRAHPDWRRGIGAVGPANMMMSGDGAEAAGTLVRIPRMEMGVVALGRVGALAVSGGRGAIPGMSLLDWYSTKNAVPVAGWIGGNVLKNFRLTIDYPGRKIYWQRESDPESGELDQVGLTLRIEHGEYVVDGIATRNGRPAVEGVTRGDRLLAVGGITTSGASMGKIFQAMHGKPGEILDLVVERGGRRISISARISAF